jgi:N-acetylated-alpha-linked acidic dipeptidase
MKPLSSCLLFLCLSAVPAVPQSQAPMRGYSAADSATERDWESKLRAIPEPANVRAYMQRLSARPHHVGSPYDKDNAEWLLAQFKEWGLDAHIESFDVLFPTPKERLLEMVEPTRFTARIAEPTVPVDPTSSQHDEQLPTYNAYSKDGDVTAPLVYVNYGVPDDYDALERLGISVKGAIVIARYGGSWRGIKPKVAAEHGAIGCLIYSDPRDDGYVAGDVYPNGPYRPKDGVQRGSVMDMPIYPGDPLTPGVGATRDAKRLPLDQAATITKIPVMPISYGDAEPMLAAMKGPVAPPSWRGGLPVTYHIGPGPAKVHLKLAFNWDLKPLYDVIVRIPGSVYPDEWIIRGNHHDAWHQYLLRVGWRGAGTAGLNRMGRNACRRVEAARRRVHQFRQQQPRLPAGGGLAHAGEIRQRRGARYSGSRVQSHCVAAHAGPTHGRRRWAR